ncbi:glycosyltransferase family 2 protein [Sphingobium lignivorans]|uniref:Cellulose synthase/poly-beta-1,6-N-acetylglucosamine synthase-like glycosyltransferase n=1 Tax=Sphingobium lignivorans TaxID=2735886 RepID=A0ABR6NBL6_9SPHN|nr:glycosyltransferase family 2 protein [Sphingobium lignivorans]MBB5984663.1 cellulose synthase/poly-beta-1,6-N-acetylglucosamine synthase-like glycosyltransferase [Sphingobium lignivorans]
MIADIIAWCLAAVPLALLIVLAIELLAGILARPARPAAPDSGRPRAAILMPAHDEAGGIAATIERLWPALDETISLMVIADNCTDDTARIARAAGATVLERHDTARRGKGHALAFGRDHLRGDPPDCVVVLDADCEIGRDDLRLLIDSAARSGRPVQSCYLLRSRPGDSAMTQISNFAFLIKNRVRQRGAASLGAPAILGGTGMAFPWTLMADAPLATSHLVEDLVLGIDFARRGHAPAYLEQATTWSDPASQKDTLTQRTRWEHGYIQTALRQGLPLFAEGIGRLRPGLAWFGLSLMVPPLALLMSASLAALSATIVLALIGASPVPALALALALALTALLLMLGWARDGRQAVSAATLARIPLYLAWKIPVYLRLARGGETRWVRTKRAGED